MRKPFYLFASMILFLPLIFISCINQTKESEEPAKIENTLQSVSYFSDTVGLDPQALLKSFTIMNEAIDEIGYPDAGYKLWVNQAEDSEIRFMVEGLWPDKATYDIIHENQLYIDASNADSNQFNGLVSVEYHRFGKVK